MRWNTHALDWPPRFPAWMLAVCLTVFGTSAILRSDAMAEAVPAGMKLPDRVQFNRDIRPILSDHCFQCHGPDEKHRKAELRLDTREGVVGDAGVIWPGDSKLSTLYQRVSSSNPRRVMPPPKFNKPLKPQQIALLKKWIDQGAKYQGQWAFITPKRPTVPDVPGQHNAHNPIERFIQAQLLREGLKPSPEADRRTLIRRVTFDLTGLPPTPAEVNVFVKDTSPDAYEKVVDRLLASPHFGEHRARYWLDAVRYGDTHGLHLDNYREMWAYRDYLIQAYNQNKPFDQFTIEQLAGDLLPNPTRSQLVASGYNRAHVTTNEGGSIVEEVYVRNVIDRVSTTSTVWMGLTAGCAVCHEHKFDPLSQKEFYQLFAFFNNMDGRAMDGNKRDPAPVIRVPTPAQKQLLADLDNRIARLQQQLDQRTQEPGPGFDKWLARVSAQSSGKEALAASSEGLIAHYTLDEGKGTVIRDAVAGKPAGQVKGGSPAWQKGKFGSAFSFDGQRHIDLGQVADFKRDQSFSYGAWIRWAGGRGGMAPLARMNDGNAFRGYDLYIANGQVAVHILHSWPTDGIKVTSKARIKRNQWTHLFVTYDGSSKASGLKLYIDGKLAPVAVNLDNLKNTIHCATPLQLGRRNPGSGYRGLVDEVRLYQRALTATEVSALAGSDPVRPILAIAPAKRTPQQQKTLRTHYLNLHDPAFRKLANTLASAQAQRQSAESKWSTTLVMRERSTPRPAHVLVRGEYDKKGPKVERQTPAFLPSMPKEAPRDRLGFARWLTDSRHPLTARVTVNRLWQQLFGVGIVKTSEDFGAQGSWPTHPELLDWLAVEFVESGWDVKRILRLMVTSATYRQSSHRTPELQARDPQNRLLARGPRFRLDAEMIRDQALAASDLLVRRLGGPSVKPPQPKGLWSVVGYTSSNTARFKPDSGSKIYRRSVYTFWKRTSPPPQMTTFDAPSREACTVRRERTNTPLQALVLMNEKQFVEAARHLAQRTLHEGGKTPEERIRFAFLQLTAREPNQADRADLLAAHEVFRKNFQARPETAKKLIRVGDTAPDPSLDPVELASWTMVANLILNLDEALNKE